MKIPTFTFTQSSNVNASTWKEVEQLAKQVMQDTSGIIEYMSSRDMLFTMRVDGEIVGISTATFKAEVFNGKKVCSISQGSTWVHKDWRNIGFPQIVALYQCFYTKMKFPTSSIFWFIGSNNYRSYRVFAQTLSTFWPHPDQQTPNWEREYMQHLGVHYYGDTFNTNTLVDHPTSFRPFSESDYEVSDSASKNRFVQHYLQLNPGYTKGDSLACLIPINAKTFLELGQGISKRVTRKIFK